MAASIRILMPMTRYLRPFTFNEKFAGGLLVLFVPVYLVGAVSLLKVRVDSGQLFTALPLWQLAWLLIALLAAVAALATLFLRPDHHPSHLRMNLGRILPLAALILAGLSSTAILDAFAKREMRAFAQLHSAHLAGPPPRAVIYREGIPDGGVAVVRSPGRNPESLPQAAMIDLTGERIKSCEPLSETDWSCHYD